MKVDEERYNFIINNIFIVGLYLAGVLFIVGQDRGLLSILLGTVLIFLELYWSHRILHLITPDSVLHWYNPHIPVHHAKVKPLSRTYELLSEVFGTDVLHVSYVIIPQLITGIWLIPLSVLLVAHVTYSMVHLINYSLVGNKIHRAHHMDVDVNYGPDFMDHLFGTNGSEVHEDPIIYLLPLVIAIGSVWLLKRWIGWTD